MISAIIKLVCAGIAMLGPFFAGAMIRYVREPEVYAFFLIGGVMLGLMGLCGFASIERDEQRRHARTLRSGG